MAKPFSVGDTVVRRVGKRGERGVIKEVDREYFEPCALVAFDDYEQTVALSDIEHLETLHHRQVRDACDHLFIEVEGAEPPYDICYHCGMRRD